MKKISIILALILALGLVHAKILITEVYYDPVQTETGGEAVLLFNPENLSVEIGDWFLRTKSSTKDSTIPSGTILKPFGYYLLADAGWNLSKDDSSWPYASHEEAITLSNSDSGVAIVNPEGIVVDSVGWGNPDEIPAGLFEGIPTTGVPQGESIQRKKIDGIYLDSDDNSEDFFGAMPLFYSIANSPSLQYIDVIINLTGSIRIKKAEILDDDFNESGIQILPFPGANRSLSLIAEIEGQYTSVYAYFLSEIYNFTNFSIINGTIFANASIDIPFYQHAGNYSVEIIAENSAGEKDKLTVDFEILEISGISIEKKELTLNGFNSSVSTAITNIGNSKVSIELSSTNFSSEQKQIPAMQLGFKLKSQKDGGIKEGNFSEKMQNTNFSLYPSDVAIFELLLNVQNASKEVYKGKVFITGTK